MVSVPRESSRLQTLLSVHHEIHPLGPPRTPNTTGNGPAGFWPALSEARRRGMHSLGDGRPAGWGCVEVTADDNSGVGVWEKLYAGQEVVGGGRQGVLVAARPCAHP